ncbi:uncharacterized protein [Ptychodera flava]|uniref:uncharacterized protein n=1 Tax=Ptychodera flava TaxID=63121 RepID=UPI00396A3BF9
MDTPERIKLSRRAHRGQMTKILNQLDEFMETAEDGLNEAKLDKIQAKLELASAKLQQLQVLDQNLIDKTEDADLETVIVEADDYHSANKQRLVVCERHLNRLSEKFTKSTQKLDPSAEEFKPTSAMLQNYKHVKNVQLPKLALAKFSGDILKWQSFFDSFQAAVHNDPSLDNIQKFQYLRAQLSDEAARAIEGLSLTAANYSNAIELLVKRYGQPHMVKAAYMKALWELPRPNGDLASLREFYDATETYIRGLQSLGKDESSYGDLLVPIIMEKLPSRIRELITRDHGTSREWSLQELREAISREIDASLAGQPLFELLKSSSQRPPYNLSNRKRVFLVFGITIKGNFRPQYA